MRKQKEPIDLSIHIAFHIQEDVKASSESARLIKQVSSIFQDALESTTEIVTNDSREIVTKIRRPLMSSNEDEREFFEKVLHLFELTHAKKPHFTNSSS